MAQYRFENQRKLLNKEYNISGTNEVPEIFYAICPHRGQVACRVLERDEDNSPIDTLLPGTPNESRNGKPACYYSFEFMEDGKEKTFEGWYSWKPEIIQEQIAHRKMPFQRYRPLSLRVK